MFPYTIYFVSESLRDQRGKRNKKWKQPQIVIMIQGKHDITEKDYLSILFNLMWEPQRSPIKLKIISGKSFCNLKLYNLHDMVLIFSAWQQIPKLIDCKMFFFSLSVFP